MTNENANLKMNDIQNQDIVEEFDFDALEEKLQKELEENLSDLQYLKEEKDRIGSLDNLGDVIKDVVWEQFLNQVAVTAGEDFIKENRGLHLDLRKESHIQTTENFEKGRIAKHNTEIDYQNRYDNWQKNFEKDATGSVVTHETRTGKKEPNLVKGARRPFDVDRPTGSREKHIDMDHTVSAAEIIRDAHANAHMTKEEQIAFANSDANLQKMDSSLNRSNEDSKMRQKDREARNEYEKQKRMAEQKSIDAGKKSRKKEAFRIGGKALRAALMQLLAEFVREIILHLIKWLSESKKTLDSLLNSLRKAIHSFVSEMKSRLMSVGNTVLSTVFTAIIGPVFGTIKKVCIMLKQGWKSLKSAIEYIKSPENKGKPIGRLMMEVGKIVIAGMTSVGAMVVGEVIEKSLITIPIFAFEIPMIGSLANILGVFFGAVVVGIIGAIAINLIDKQIEQQTMKTNMNNVIGKGNEVLIVQHQLKRVNKDKLGLKKTKNKQKIKEYHDAAASEVEKSIEIIRDNCAVHESVKECLDDIDQLFNELEN